VLPFTWDGQTDAGVPAADGSYKFSVEAVLSGNKTAPASLAFGMVNAVTPGAQGATLEVGKLGGFALSAVKQVL
jgi:flagellar basal-body rod modification protein FlgD